MTFILPLTNCHIFETLITQTSIYGLYNVIPNSIDEPIAVTARAKASVWGRSLLGTAGSNPAGGMEDCLLWSLCVVRQRSLRQSDPSSWGVLQCAVWLISVIAKPRDWRPFPGIGSMSHRNSTDETRIYSFINRHHITFSSPSLHYWRQAQFLCFHVSTYTIYVLA